MKKARELWQISVEVAREAEEAVAALLERLFGQPASVYAEDAKVTSLVTVYSSQAGAQVRSRREALESGLRLIATCDLQLGPAVIQMRKVAREDWTKSWQKCFKVIEIGRTLLIKPSWSKRSPRSGQAVVTLDPGLSFGTGQHPTTAFCLEQLARGRQRGQAQSFLDIGTGSGILAIAAAKLGYQPIRAFDNDPVAVRVAQANARRNRVERRLTIVRQDLTKGPLRSRSQYDLICANLVDDLLIEQAIRIVNRLRPSGRLVLAGLLVSQFERVQSTYEALGLCLVVDQVESGWRSGAFVGQS